MPRFSWKGFTQISACLLQDLAPCKSSCLDGAVNRAVAEIFCFSGGE